MRKGTTVLTPTRAVRRTRLTAIGTALRATEASEARLIRRVREARDQGITWREIGEVLGVGRTAAQARFGRHCQGG